MRPLLLRMAVALLFIGVLGMAVWGRPVAGQTGEPPKQYFPLMSANVPGNLDPDFRHYVGVGVSDADGDLEVYTVRGDSSELRQLTHNEVTDRYPAFSPDGTQLVLTREFPLEGEDETRYQVVLMNRDGSHERVLWEVQRPDSLFRARWSPRGQHLLIMGEGDPHAAWVLGLDGAVQPLAGNPLDIYSAVQWWSPDGRYVSYRVLDDDTTRLYITNIATNSTVIIGENVLNAWWAPDSRELLIADSVGNQQRAIMVQPDGSGERELISGNYYIYGWVRNGQYIVAKATAESDKNFYLVPRGGGTPVSLTNADDSYIRGQMEAAGVGILYEQTPRAGGDTKIYWLPFDTRIPRFVADKNITTSLSSPVLSQDHTRLLYNIFYCVYRYCGNDFYEVHLDDPTATPRSVPRGATRYLPNASNRAAVQYGDYPAYYLMTIEMVQLDPPSVTAVDFTNAFRVREMSEWRYLP